MRVSHTVSGSSRITIPVKCRSAWAQASTRHPHALVHREAPLACSDASVGGMAKKAWTSVLVPRPPRDFGQDRLRDVDEDAVLREES
ncbi:hypothetical protein GCM10010267_48400 [Streptomyces griseorubens]|nr:hypothetical protein GCM10010267_48400 [Streptomyces griseorubens]